MRRARFYPMSQSSNKRVNGASPSAMVWQSMIIRLSTTIHTLASTRVSNLHTRKNRLRSGLMRSGTEGSRSPSRANWLNTDIIMIAFLSPCTCEVIMLIVSSAIFMHSFCHLFRWSALASSVSSCGCHSLLASPGPTLVFVACHGSFPFRANSISAIWECSCIPAASLPIAKCIIQLFYPSGTRIVIVNSAIYFSYCLSVLSCMPRPSSLQRCWSLSFLRGYSLLLTSTYMSTCFSLVLSWIPCSLGFDASCSGP